MTAFILHLLLAVALGAFSARALGLSIAEWRFWVLLAIANGMHITGRAM